MGVDQVRFLPADKLLQHPHVGTTVRAVGNSVHLEYPGPRLFQGRYQQTAPRHSHPSLKPAAVCIAEIIENDPSGSADVCIADDVHYPDHMFRPLSGSWPRRASRPPRAMNTQNRNMTR